ncbi:unnamed protein product [Didymodactylos carnosus]|uniref:Uncharacterized protein n=1 Tax=Didymodactylos carnosus TaxID=1234261 RepID=A0A815DBR1_9BILA|nr:unnamed protein product [Didymodactylos carnosus]CAF4111512.1 unnamed protein product [Didymodactylos carnosus]
MRRTQSTTTSTPLINKESIKNDIFEILSNDNHVKEQVQALRGNYGPEDVVNILQDAVVKRIEQRLTIVEQKTEEIEQQLGQLQFDMNARERNSRQKNLRFLGIKDQGDITVSIVQGAEKIGLDIKKEDIEYCHPLGRNKKDLHTRPVIAAFHSRFKLKSLLVKRKQFKEATGITIFEDLTKSDKWLLDQIRDGLKKEDKKYAFTRGGRACYKTESQGVVFINSFGDIETYLYG